MGNWSDLVLSAVRTTALHCQLSLWPGGEHPHWRVRVGHSSCVARAQPPPLTSVTAVSYEGEKKHICNPNSPIRFEYPDTVSEDARDFLQRILIRDPEQRLSLEEMLVGLFSLSLSLFVILSVGVRDETDTLLPLPSPLCSTITGSVEMCHSRSLTTTQFL